MLLGLCVCVCVLPESAFERSGASRCYTKERVRIFATAVRAATKTGADVGPKTRKEGGTDQRGCGEKSFVVDEGMSVC